jgi:predicted amidophosphoribosyltransferase
VLKCPYCKIHLERHLTRMSLSCPTCKRELSREAIAKLEAKSRWAAQDKAIQLGTAAEHDVDWLKTMNIRWS